MRLSKKKKLDLCNIQQFHSLSHVLAIPELKEFIVSARKFLLTSFLPTTPPKYFSKIPQQKNYIVNEAFILNFKQIFRLFLP